MSIDSPVPERKRTLLRANVLPFSEVLAQSVANIAPTVTAALSIPLIFASAGGAVWLTLVIATIGLILVGMNVAVFAKRAATPGSLYSYVSSGMGRSSGFLVGWALILAYVICGAAVLLGFGYFSQIIFKSMGVNVPMWIFLVFGGVSTWLFAYKDIRLSARTMLVTEVASMVSIVLLGIIVIVVATHRGGFDTSQFKFSTFSASGIRLGLVLAVFAFVGFETAASLGFEARNPAKSVPRAVILSCAAAGLFFILMGYAEVAGFGGFGGALDQSSTPLNDLADNYHVHWLGIVTNFGAALSFWGCTLASLNAASRVVYAMGFDGELFSKFGDAHDTNQTPHIAATVAAIIMICVPAIMVTHYGVAPMDGYGYLGSLSVFGFLVAYIMVSIAAPIALYRAGSLKAWNIVISAVATLFMLLPVYGSLIPVPPVPYNRLPYIFLGYMAVGFFAWVATARRNPAREMISVDLMSPVSAQPEIAISPA